MSWSYDPDLLTDLDKVRALVGDTDTDDQQLPDGVIDFLLTQRSSVMDAAAMAARAIAANYARDVSKQIGRAQEEASNRFDHYQKLADMLEAQGGGATAGDSPLVFAGGIDPGNVDYWNHAADRIAPAFTRATMNEFLPSGNLGDE